MEGVVSVNAARPWTKNSSETEIAEELPSFSLVLLNFFCSIYYTNKFLSFHLISYFNSSFVGEQILISSSFRHPKSHWLNVLDKRGTTLSRTSHPNYNLPPRLHIVTQFQPGARILQCCIPFSRAQEGIN